MHRLRECIHDADPLHVYSRLLSCLRYQGLINDNNKIIRRSYRFSTATCMTGVSSTFFGRNATGSRRLKASLVDSQTRSHKKLTAGTTCVPLQRDTERISRWLCGPNEVTLYLWKDSSDDLWSQKLREILTEQVGGKQQEQVLRIHWQNRRVHEVLQRHHKILSERSWNLRCVAVFT